jgi:hypothetical protein
MPFEGAGRYILRLRRHADSVMKCLNQQASYGSGERSPTLPRAASCLGKHRTADAMPVSDDFRPNTVGSGGQVFFEPFAFLRGGGTIQSLGKR